MITRKELEEILWDERETAMALYKKGALSTDLTIGRIGGLQRIAMRFCITGFVDTTALDFYNLRNREIKHKAPRRDAIKGE